MSDHDFALVRAGVAVGECAGCTSRQLCPNPPLACTNALDRIQRRYALMKAERNWLARRLSLVDSPTPLTGAFNLNEQGEANVPRWLDVAAREVAGSLEGGTR